MERRCLFTNRLLDDKTKVEHTIPRSLCGKIYSRSVTCSEFNEASSQCDEILKKEFIVILGILSPMLSGFFEPGEIHVKLENGWDAIEQGGLVFIKKPVVLDRDPSGMPKEIFCRNDPQVVERTLKRFGIKEYQFKTLPIPGEMAFVNNIPVCSNQSAISILKSILCTIDVILQKKGEELFTRNEAMKPLIAFIRESVSKKADEIDLRTLDQYYMGVQILDQEAFGKCLSFHKYKAKPFEHVILFSSNAATKTFNAAWNILSHEVHGVRLSTRWNGPCVCGYIANPIFQNERVSSEIILGMENPFFMVKKTSIKGFSFDPASSPADFQLYPMILRELACYDAIAFVETNCDHHLTEAFRGASNSNKQASLFDLFIARLRRRFHASYGDDLEQELKRIEQEYGSWKAHPSSILFNNNDPLLHSFIQDYKKVFSSLAKDLHTPSKIVHKVSVKEEVIRKK